jgi:hypothetical protein
VGEICLICSRIRPSSPAFSTRSAREKELRQGRSNTSEALSLWELTRVGIAGRRIETSGAIFTHGEWNTENNGFIPWFVQIARLSFRNEGLARVPVRASLRSETHTQNPAYLPLLALWEGAQVRAAQEARFYEGSRILSNFQSIMRLEKS